VLAVPRAPGVVLEVLDCLVVLGAFAHEVLDGEALGVDGERGLAASRGDADECGLEPVAEQCLWVLLCEGETDLVAHAVITYAIPPKAMTS